jgi:hypothetical protein
MKNLKLLVAYCLIILTSIKSSAQENNSNVTITASGRGASQAEAQQYALRSAIEQAFGAFISSKTEILNDEIVADQMASVASGNIQSFEILNETELPDHSWASTIKAVVSVEKLTNFVQSKGIEVEIKGGLFAANIKQQMLNEQGEVEAIYNMVGVLHEVMQTAFDYSLSTENPKSLDDSGINWEIPIKVDVTINKNFILCAGYIRKTLKSLSLSESEIESYKISNKKTFKISLSFPTKITLISGAEVYQSYTETYILRKNTSIAILNFFFDFWPLYLSNYEIITKMEKEIKEPNLQNKFHLKHQSKQPTFYNAKENFEINLYFKENSSIVSFQFSDKKSLKEIEMTQGYTIKSLQVRSKLIQGGIKIIETSQINSKNIVVAMIDLRSSNYQDALDHVSNLSLGGFSDWRLPTQEELEYVIQNQLTTKTNILIDKKSDFDYSTQILAVRTIR